jgi:hypothetical protein
MIPTIHQKNHESTPFFLCQPSPRPRALLRVPDPCPDLWLRCRLRSLYGTVTDYCIGYRYRRFSFLPSPSFQLPVCAHLSFLHGKIMACCILQ